MLSNGTTTFVRPKWTMAAAGLAAAAVLALAVGLARPTTLPSVAVPGAAPVPDAAILQVTRSERAEADALLPSAAQGQVALRRSEIAERAAVSTTVAQALIDVRKGEIAAFGSAVGTIDAVRLVTQMERAESFALAGTYPAHYGLAGPSQVVADSSFGQTYPAHYGLAGPSQADASSERIGGR